MSDILKVAQVVKEVGLVGGVITLVAIIKDSKGTKETTIKEIPEQTLFVQTNPYNDFPSIYDEEGVPFVITYIRDTVVGKAAKETANFAKEANMKLALVRLEKGFLIDTNGVIYSNKTVKGTTRKIAKEFIYTNEGVCMEVLKGKNFGGVKNGSTFSTKGIDQVKAMSEYGIKAKSWKLLEKVSENVFNIMYAAQFVLDMGNSKRTLSSLPAVTPMTAVVGAIGVLGDIYLNNLEQDLNDIRIQKLEAAKRQGLVFVRDFVNKDINVVGHPKSDFGYPLDDGEFVYYLFYVSKETASKLLTGEFRVIHELFPFLDDPSHETVLLIKKVGHPKFVNTIYIIETFYVLK